MVTDRRIKQTATREEEPAYLTQPHHLEAGQGLLGALMLDHRALARVSDVLRPYHFHISVQQRLYEAILKPLEPGQIVGPITLKNDFEQDGDLEHVGGTEYLAKLASGVVTIINAEDDGYTTYDSYMRRELIALGQDL